MKKTPIYIYNFTGGIKSRGEVKKKGKIEIACQTFALFTNHVNGIIEDSLFPTVPINSFATAAKGGALISSHAKILAASAVLIAWSSSLRSLAVRLFKRGARAGDTPAAYPRSIKAELTGTPTLSAARGRKTGEPTPIPPTPRVVDNSASVNTKQAFSKPGRRGVPAATGEMDALLPVLLLVETPGMLESTGGNAADINESPTTECANSVE